MDATHGDSFGLFTVRRLVERDIGESDKLLTELSVEYAGSRSAPDASAPSVHIHLHWHPVSGRAH